MENKNLSKGESILILSISMLVLIVCIFTSIPLYIGFFIGIIFTSIVLGINGYKLSFILNISINSVLEAKMLYILILLIGATTSVWLSSGAVPTIMFYGFYYMQDMNFLLCAFLIITFVSVFVGTAVGTVSTVGIAVLGIGRGFGIPDAILMGVIVSGAFIADKISPISGLLNLTLDTVGKGYKQVAKKMLITLIPTIIITALIYYIIGLRYVNIDNSQIEFYRNQLLNSFNITPILLILPLIILLLSFLGLKLTRTISLGLGIGIIFSIVFQKSKVKHIISWVIFGFKGATTSNELNNILVSGGVISMIEVIFIVAGAVALVGIFEKCKIITPIIDKYIENAKTKSSLIYRTGIISSILTIVTCDQTVGIILPGKLFKSKYEEMKVDLAILARTISDTGIIIAPLMIWNVNAILIKPITGVSALSYAPYAVLCYIAPIVTFFLAKRIK